MNDRSDDAFDLTELLHPAQAFESPDEVVNDPDLTLNEKRAILASWASDACAVEAAPGPRATPRGQPVAFDQIMDALRILDRQAHLADSGRKHRVSGRRRWEGPAGSNDRGSALH
jgi:hypothetical protein